MPKLFRIMSTKKNVVDVASQILYCLFFKNFKKGIIPFVVYLDNDSLLNNSFLCRNSY